ncbi:MAG: helix-turn-helix transcriptional regulator [Prevotella sp.]|nr:helix-turn-helix transcriptional regulator [Prevotella sp.]MBR0269500.1 helix-turn-helix transcriptional regulator [Prevotella sp.]
MREEKSGCRPSVNQLQILTLNVGFAKHDSNWNWKNVRSPFSRIFFVTEGTAQLQLPSVTILLRPGHMYFIPAFTTHSYICDSVFHLYYIHIYEEEHVRSSFFDEWQLPNEVKADDGDELLVSKLCSINPFLKLPQSDPDSYDNHATLINNLKLNLRRPFCDKVESRGILYILMARFLKHATPKAEVRDDRIGAALTYIRRHLHERIEVRMLAEEICMSKDHFIRIFKRETGDTPNNYITQRKIERAELALITTNQPVKVIADNLGYDDSSYFVRIFKKISGTTPQQYRENHLYPSSG